MRLFRSPADADGPAHERLWVIQHAASGLRAIVAIHDRRRGPAFGGIRRRVYESEAGGLADARALSRAMTFKCALAELPAGGAKAVVFDGPGLDVPAAYRALGDAIDELAGGYVCGPDLGTGPRELAAVRARTRHVNPDDNDAAASTARGVLAALRAVCREVAGDSGFYGRRFVLQGLGSVGLAVARSLRAADARVWAHDTDPTRREVAEDHGIGWIDAGEAVWNMPADVFVPCAVGGVLDCASANALAAKAVCGSANVVLADARVAVVLRGRGIVYAPDIVASAGAVIEGVYTVRDGGGADTRARVAEVIDATESRCLEVFDRARRSDVDHHAAALAMARDVLDRSSR